eukprot:TRINITY_DN3678_c0_g1_i5.p1 TRINITY_DN3678_c0_g1~~TRINITY_DN3678_c0_g1_i5.p1  ORF type:complete len:822 (-),score=138.80 TRINITY_DN3678_c0_g1_i5:498-2963(-)
MIRSTAVIPILLSIVYAQIWIEQTVLTASNKQVADLFGNSVALTDSHALVGAPNADADAVNDAGAAYVYVRSGTIWTEQQILVASNKAANNEFGSCVSLTDDYALIGARSASPAMVPSAGTAYVFVRSGSTWNEQAILTASNKGNGSLFGYAVSIASNYAIVGALRADPGSVNDAGAVYVFTRSETAWTQHVVLTASDKAALDQFGISVSLSPNYACIGANQADPGAVDSAGAAYIFVRSDSTWTEQVILTAGNKAKFDEFGLAVAVTDNFALVGLSSSVGRCYIFSRTGVSWMQQQILSTSGGERSIGLTEFYLVVKEKIFIRVGSTWVSQTNVTRATVTSAALTGNYALMGNIYGAPGGVSNAGEAYIILNTVTQSRSRSCGLQCSSSKSRSKSNSRSKSQTVSKSKSRNNSKSRSKNNSRSKSQSGIISAAPPQQMSGSDSADIIPVIVGACAGAVVLVGILLCLRRKLAQRRMQREAALERTDKSHHETIAKETVGMNDLPSVKKPLPDTLGSVFMSIQPNAHDTPPFDSNHAQTHPDSSSIQPPTLTISRFGDYSDIKDVVFSDLEPIGAGAFGIVYRVELRAGVVAAKVPKMNMKLASKQSSDMLAEAEFLSKLRHTHITLLLGYGSHQSGTLVFVMEFADSSLADALQSGPLDAQRLIEYGHGIVRGLLYLHTHTPPISHRDLKPENVLIVKGVAKLADFGLAVAREAVCRTTGFAGTPCWSPPESFEGRFTGPAGDVYTFGLLVWAMMTGRTPYAGKGFDEILRAKSMNQVPDLPPHCPSPLGRLVRLSWKKNARHRPRAHELEAVFVEMRDA